MTHPTVTAALDASRALVVGYVRDCPGCAEARHEITWRDDYITELEHRLTLATERANAAETELKAVKRRAGMDGAALSRTLIDVMDSEPDYGGAFDGYTVYSDADEGL